MNTIALIFILLIAFQIKHFVVDYVVQSYRKDGMAKFQKTGWFIPLAKHATDHGIGTALIATITFLTFGSNVGGLYSIFWILGLWVFDSVIHFTMDRIKASPYILGRFKVEDKLFWMSLGLDQMVHHLTHYAIIGIILYAIGII